MEETIVAKVTSLYTITIPIEIREKCNIEPGDAIKCNLVKVIKNQDNEV